VSRGLRVLLDWLVALIVTLIVALVVAIWLRLNLDVDNSSLVSETTATAANNDSAAAVAGKVPHHGLTSHHLASFSCSHQHAQQQADKNADHPPHGIQPSFVAACSLCIVVTIVAPVA
ncbi:MAG: hypothetical protein ACK55Z_04870, partial [bacterium]